MATFTSTAGARLVKKDSTTSNDTYVVLDDSKGLVLTGNANGDTIKIDGLSTDFTFKASGKTLTLTSVDDSSFRIQVQIANGGSVILGFLDGGLTASYASTSSAKGVTLAGSAGTQKVTSKAAALADAVSVNEATASVDTFDTTTGSSTTSGSGVSVTLTTNVETATGTAFNDLFAANALNGAVTFNAGDIINGGSGEDILNLLANDDTTLAQVNSVETVNVRLLSSIDLNALDFSGVTTVNITTDSVNDNALTVLNASQAITFKISDDANLTIDYLDDSGSADVAKLAANGAGVSASAATFTVSATEAVTLGLSGANFIQVSAGDTALRDITVSGVGTLSLEVSETSLSGLSLAQFSGTSTVTLGVASNVNLTGGTGADAFAFGTTFNGSDTVNGGAGSDTLTASVQGLVGLSRVTNVETATFTAGTTTTIIDASGASFSTINIAEITGSVDLAINSIGTVELNLANVGTEGDIALDFAGTNANLDLAQSGVVTYDTLSFTDASAVDVSVDGGSGTVTFSAVSLDSDAKAFVIGVNSGSVVMSAIAASDLTSLVVAVAGSGDFLNASIAASGLTTVSLGANGGSAEIDFGGVTALGASFGFSELASGNLASVAVGDLTASGAATLNVTSNGSGAVADTGNIVFGTAASTLTLSANGASAQADVGTVLGVNSGVYTVNVSASGVAASADVGNLTFGTSGRQTISLVAGADANVVVGDITTGTAGASLTLSATGTGSGDITVGNVAVGSADSTTGTTVSLSFAGGSADVTFGTIDVTNLSSITGSVGDAGSATVGVVSAGSIGNITLSGSGTVVLAMLDAVSGIGNITVGAGVLTASADASSIGNISIGGDGATLTLNVNDSVGNIVVSGSGGAFISNAAQSATFGNITIAGHGAVLIDVGDATGVGSVSTVGHSGEVTLQFGSSVDQIVGSLGAGSGEVFISLAGSTAGSLNGDIYTLASSTGVSDFHILSSGNSDAVIAGFDLSTGTDRFTFEEDGFDLGYGSAVGFSSQADATLDVEDISGASTLAAATDVVVLRSGTFASDVDMVSAISTGGRYEIQGAGTGAAGYDMLIVWADTNGDSHLTLVNTVASTAGQALFSSTSNVNQIALLDDVNVATFSGADFQGAFFVE